MITDWGDLQTIYWLAKAGTLSGAARGLGVSQSTMSRRLMGIERRLDRPVFERRAEGFVPTPLGREVIALARSMHEAFECAVALLGPDTAIRIATCEALAQLCVVPVLARWGRERGGTGEVMVFDNLFDLPDESFDVLVTPRENAPSDMVGRKLTNMPWGLFASRDFAAENGLSAESAGAGNCALILSSGPLAQVDACRAFAASGGTPVMRASNLQSQREAAARGVGIALLPVGLGEADERLLRVCAGVTGVTEVWIAARPAAARRPRVGAFLKWLRGQRVPDPAPP